MKKGYKRQEVTSKNEENENGENEWNTHHSGPTGGLLLPTERHKLSVSAAVALQLVLLGSWVVCLRVHGFGTRSRYTLPGACWVSPARAGSPEPKVLRARCLVWGIFAGCLRRSDAPLKIYSIIIKPWKYQKKNDLRLTIPVCLI